MKKHLILLLSFLLISTSVFAESNDDLKETTKTAQGTVEALYKLVTFEKGKVPNWEDVKYLFHEDAVITLRTSMADMTTMDVKGFVDLFVNDIKKMKMDESGFAEEIQSIKVRSYGRIAQAFVIYTADIPGDARPPMPGLDCFTLIQNNNRWYITAIANDLVHPAKAVPEEFVK